MTRPTDREYIAGVLKWGDSAAGAGIRGVSGKANSLSVGNAYFDSETGILLYYNTLWGASKMFFILAEINYDFARQAAFAEDGGPHCGFKSFVIEQSNGNGWVGGGSVVIQSAVESRYGNDIEMWVQSSYNGPVGLHQAIENYCFFGNVPVVKRIGPSPPNCLKL